MPAAARLSDNDTSDGSIASGVSNDVIINGQGAAIVGSVESSHAPYSPSSKHKPHEAATITSGSSTVIVNGQAMAYVGSDLSCGHTISSGSPDVEIGS